MEITMIIYGDLVSFMGIKTKKRPTTSLDVVG